MEAKVVRRRRLIRRRGPKLMALDSPQEVVPVEVDQKATKTGVEKPTRIKSRSHQAGLKGNTGRAVHGSNITKGTIITLLKRKRIAGLPLT